MPQSPSKSPNSPKNQRSNLNSDRRKTDRSSALGVNGGASAALNDGIIVKDPSVISIKNPRYPSGQTALYVHPTSSMIPKDANTWKGTSKAGSLSGGFQIPMMMDSTKAVKLSGINASTMLPTSGQATPSGSPAPLGPTSSSAASTTPSGPQSPNSETGKVISPSDLQKSGSTATPAKPTEPGVAPEETRVPMSTGIKIEFACAITASLVFLGLWIYLMTTNCYQNLELIFWVKTFSLVGFITSLFIAIYCCFESNLSPRSGMTGCLFLTCLVVVISLNLIGAYLTIAKCICKCDKNALKDGREDLAIAILEVVGSTLLIVVLIVASVSTTQA